MVCMCSSQALTQHQLSRVRPNLPETFHYSALLKDKLSVHWRGVTQVLSMLYTVTW